MDGKFVENLKNLIDESIIRDVDGIKYSAANMKPVVDSRSIDTIEISTLTGFVDYVNSKVDDLDPARLFVLVKSHKEVVLVSGYNDSSFKRQKLITTNLSGIDCFRFGQFMDVESFIINLKSKFVETEDQKSLLKFASRLTSENSIKIEDDGITQSATVKKGISGAVKGEESARSIVTLYPYRTFNEIAQPESKFLFRLSGKPGEPYLALFEADGGAWINTAIMSIRDYLREKLPEFTIIA